MPSMVGMRGLRRTDEPFKGLTRRRTPIVYSKTVLKHIPYTYTSFRNKKKEIIAHLSSCKFFNSLSSSSLRRLETSQRSMSRSEDTFSSSARNRITSFVKSIVAISTTIDNYRHGTSLVTSSLSAPANHVRAF